MIRLFDVFISKRMLLLCIADCTLLTACYLCAAALLTEVFNAEMFLLYENGAASIGFVVSVVLVSMYATGMYAPVRVRSRLLLVQTTGQVIGIAFLAEALLFYVDPGLVMPRNVMIAGSSLALLLLSIWRVVYNSVNWGQFGTDRILFAGAGAPAAEVAAMISGNPVFTLLGVVDNNLPPGDSWCGTKVLGGLADLQSIAASIKPGRIALFFPDRRQSMPLKVLLDLHFSGVHVEDGSALYEAICGRISVERLRPSDVIFHNTVGPRPGSVALQSIYTNLVALCLFVLFVPLLPFIALAVKLSSPGPIFERETRVGFRGLPFTLLRFRTTYLDGGRRRHTRAGRLIRLFRLDRLLQLWNVVRGEMAFIGPRPDRPEFVSAIRELIPFYAQKQCVRPGLTGWSQVHCRGKQATDTIRVLEHDLYYMKNISLVLDAYIVLRTFKLLWQRP